MKSEQTSNEKFLKVRLDGLKLCEQSEGLNDSAMGKLVASFPGVVSICGSANTMLVELAGRGVREDVERRILNLLPGVSTCGKSAEEELLEECGGNLQLAKIIIEARVKQVDEEQGRALYAGLKKRQRIRS